MADVTLDAVIRRYLAMSRLPMHYYVPMLVVAKQGLDEMHFDALQKVKYVVLPVGTNSQAALPVDFVELVGIGTEVGDKIKPMGFSGKINPRDNSNEAFPQTEDQVMAMNVFNNTATFIENFYNEYGSYTGKQFGRNLTWHESYTINRDLGIIRVDNKFEGDEILLIYLALPEKVSNKSVLHPFAQRALLEFIGWQKAAYFREKDMIQYKRQEFYNEYRKLRARLNKLTTTEIKRAVRRNINLAVKS